MKTFKDFKENILRRAEKKGACKDQIKLAQKCRNRYQFLKIIINNIVWCYTNNVITIEDLQFYTKKELQNHNIYINYKGRIKNKCHVFNSSVEAWDNSSVIASGNSSVVAFNDSSVIASGNSYIFANNSINKHEIKEKAIMRDYNNNKIYIKKTEFEIVEL